MNKILVNICFLVICLTFRVEGIQQTQAERDIEVLSVDAIIAYQLPDQQQCSDQQLYSLLNKRMDVVQTYLTKTKPDALKNDVQSLEGTIEIIDTIKSILEAQIKVIEEEQKMQSSLEVHNKSKIQQDNKLKEEHVSDHKTMMIQKNKIKQSKKFKQRKHQQVYTDKEIFQKLQVNINQEDQMMFPSAFSSLQDSLQDINQQLSQKGTHKQDVVQLLNQAQRDLKELQVSYESLAERAPTFVWYAESIKRKQQKLIDFIGKC